MALAGGIYGRLFQRGANDRRGGWLFGMAFGFLLWTAGMVLTLPLLSGGRLPVGTAAIGVFLSLVIWGTTNGGLFPYVQHPLHASPVRPGALTQAGPGPNAAPADGDGRVRNQTRVGSGQDGVVRVDLGVCSGIQTQKKK